MKDCEIKLDNKGINYIDFNTYKKDLEEINFINLDYNNKKSLPLKQKFYLLPDSKNYILKINKNINKNNFSDYFMISNLLKIQPKIKDIDFPIGYVVNDSNVIGQIIKFYPNSTSLRNICISSDLNGLQSLICLDNDSLHNLFLIYLNMLDKLKYLYQNGITYIDCHAGNWVIYNNQIKLIDFDGDVVSFRQNEHLYSSMINSYIRMINRVNEQYLLSPMPYIEEHDNFKKVKCKVINLENNIRKTLI